MHNFLGLFNTSSNKQILVWAPSSRDLLRAIGHPWNHSKMFLAFSAKNDFYCWTFPSAWWCLDVCLLFPMRAVGRPRGSQCTWLRYDCVINIRSKTCFSPTMYSCYSWAYSLVPTLAWLAPARRVEGVDEGCLHLLCLIGTIFLWWPPT